MIGWRSSFPEPPQKAILSYRGTRRVDLGENDDDIQPARYKTVIDASLLYSLLVRFYYILLYNPTLGSQYSHPPLSYGPLINPLRCDSCPLVRIPSDIFIPAVFYSTTKHYNSPLTIPKMVFADTILLSLSPQLSPLTRGRR